MATITLAMIVKNEEDVLNRCLKSVKNFVDEIVIVDTGSTDNTKKIAKQFTNKVYDFTWNNDFSSARNYAFSLATCSYIMWLDADDVVSIKFQKNFKKIKQLLENKKPNVVMMRYDVAFDENNNPTFSYYRERIVKNYDGFIWQEAVHEVITPHGLIVESNYSVEHRPLQNKKYTDRNLKIYQSQIKQGIKLSTRSKYYYSRELMFNGKFKQAIKMYESFLTLTDAWKENLISACSDLSYCYQMIGDNFKAKQSLIKSFCFGTPRAEICCKLGDIFLLENCTHNAIYWYEVALKDKINLRSGAFVNLEFYNIYPLLQLCVCYYRLGNIEKAILYNSKVAKYNKNNSAYLYNKQYFENLKKT